MPAEYLRVQPVESSGRVVGGSLDAKRLKIAIIVSRFNSNITDRLLDGAIKCSKDLGVDPDNLVTVYVPGAFEIPLTAKLIAENQPVDAIICLGAVVRGDTTHYEFVASNVANGIAAVSRELSIPVIFGVLTCENTEQALDRSRDDETNKGYESFESAVWTSRVVKTATDTALF